jgi:hypothetical protein
MMKSSFVSAAARRTRLPLAVRSWIHQYQPLPPARAGDFCQPAI